MPRSDAASVKLPHWTTLVKLVMVNSLSIRLGSPSNQQAKKLDAEIVAPASPIRKALMGAPLETSPRFLAAIEAE